MPCQRQILQEMWYIEPHKNDSQYIIFKKNASRIFFILPNTSSLQNFPEAFYNATKHRLRFTGCVMAFKSSNLSIMPWIRARSLSQRCGFQVFKSDSNITLANLLFNSSIFWKASLMFFPGCNEDHCTELIGSCNAFNALSTANRVEKYLHTEITSFGSHLKWRQSR